MECLGILLALSMTEKYYGLYLLPFDTKTELLFKGVIFNLLIRPKRNITIESYLEKYYIIIFFTD